MDNQSMLGSPCATEIADIVLKVVELLRGVGGIGGLHGIGGEVMHGGLGGVARGSSSRGARGSATREVGVRGERGGQVVNGVLVGSEGANSGLIQEDRNSPTFVVQRTARYRGLSYHHIFRQKKAKHVDKPTPWKQLCGKEYLQVIHKTAHIDYIRMQRQLRIWFTDPSDEKTKDIIFANYKRNKKAREDCMDFIKEKRCGLGSLVFILDNGKTHTMQPWVVEDIFDYFLEHKPQWKMYREREVAKDVLPQLEEERVEVALNDLMAIENVEEMTGSPDEGVHEEALGGRIRKRQESSKKLKKGKKQRTLSNEFTTLKPLSHDDHVTLCQILLGVVARNDVHKQIRRWISDEKKWNKVHPKIKNASTLSKEELIDRVADWALENEIVVVRGESGIAGYTAENFYKLE